MVLLRMGMTHLGECRGGVVCMESSKRKGERLIEMDSASSERRDRINY